MGTKLEKDTFPSGHGPNDFQAFGPPSTKDGDFDNAKIADFGCFSQGDVDSNKYYHAAVVKSRKNSQWYTYFEWGRVGASSPSFQFTECSDETDAQDEFASQCHAKNDKRGQWATIGGLRTLQAKPGKDCYLVRPMATRSVGLPDGKTIKLNDGAKQKSLPITPASKTTIAKPTAPVKQIDNHTMSLMRDLNVATVNYARTSIVGAALPSQSAIDDARTLLSEAMGRVGKIGTNIDAQVRDKELVQMTTVLYSRIPKVKRVGADPSTWILSQNNIFSWQNDLDAFEAALYTQDPNDLQPTADPFNGMRLDMNWIDPSSLLGTFLYKWWPNATGNRHGGVGRMKISNMWRIRRHDDKGKIGGWQDKVLSDKVRPCDRPLYQPSERSDAEDAALIKKYKETNTALLFHGTRSVNVSGILRESWRLPKQLHGVVITGAMFGPVYGGVGGRRGKAVSGQGVSLGEG